jgi:hypothetical protein
MSRSVDPTLPRDGTGLIDTATRDGNVDPTLPRDGTDLIATAMRYSSNKEKHETAYHQSNHPK